MERLDQQLGFITEITRLKGVHRQTVLAGLDRRENSAEHSWHVALMAVTMAEHAPPGTDIGRVIAMLLAHDLVEIDAGDLFVYADDTQQARQHQAERAAADRIFALLPPDQAASLRALWDEFEERRTQEAKFARAIDRLAPMLENLRVGGGTWKEHHVTADQVLAKVTLIEDGSAELGRYARRMVAGAVRDGLLDPAPEMRQAPGCTKLES
jgi:putative hydrolase of HD superfamily